jgi:hypothetical protein
VETLVIITLFLHLKIIPFKIEAKVEIATYNGHVDAKKLNSLLKQLEVYFGFYQIKET